MKVRRQFSVFGSRLFFFALAPWLIVCIPLFPYMALTFGRGTGTVFLSAMVSLVCVIGLLVAIDAWRFVRLTIGLLFLVPIAFLGYFGQTFFADGMPIIPRFRLSEPTPFNALLGLLVWGVPSILGALSLMKKARRIRAVEERLRLRSVHTP